jgi:hypothetical protein
MLMERLPGQHLYRLWDKLTLNQKKVVLSDIARVLLQLSQLKFDKIGCLCSDNEIRPLLFRMGDGAGGERTYTSGPFHSTGDYLLSFLEAQSDGSEVFAEVRKVWNHTSQQTVNPRSLSLLFGLYMRTLTNRIFCLRFTMTFHVFPASSTGNTHMLDLSIFCTNTPFSSKIATTTKPLTRNAILRPHFLRALRRCFPKGSIDHHELDTSMKKNYTLNWFHRIWVRMAGGLWNV